MKFINLQLIFLLIMGAGAFSSCKKERIERNLWKDGGEWEIKSLIIKQTSNNPDENFTETIYNYGNYTFNKGGSGAYKINVDGGTETGDFTYSNTKEELTLSIDNESRVFEMEWEKDEMELSITEHFTTEGEAVTYKETLNLKKN